jgi:hypothetical protein
MRSSPFRASIIFASITEFEGGKRDARIDCSWRVAYQKVC